MKDKTYSFRVSPEELIAFTQAVKQADPEVSAAHAIRELMRWYAGGCGGKLKLIIPLVFPKP